MSTTAFDRVEYQTTIGGYYDSSTVADKDWNFPDGLSYRTKGLPPLPYKEISQFLMGLFGALSNPRFFCAKGNFCGSCRVLAGELLWVCSCF
jgi:hypothetical protein